MDGAKGGRRKIVHGAYTLGGLPRGSSYVGRQVAALRRALEQAVGSNRSVTTLGHINRACRHEQNALLWQRWLRVESSLTIEQRLEITRLIAASTEARDRAVGRLNLDGQTESLHERLARVRGQHGEG